MHKIPFSLCLCTRGFSLVTKGAFNSFWGFLGHSVQGVPKA